MSTNPYQKVTVCSACRTVLVWWDPGSVLFLRGWKSKAFQYGEKVSPADWTNICPQCGVSPLILKESVARKADLGWLQTFLGADKWEFAPHVVKAFSETSGGVSLCDKKD